VSQADTHFCQMILVTPGTKRGFPMFSQPTSASRLSSDRSELTLPHQHCIGLCKATAICFSHSPLWRSSVSPQVPFTCSISECCVGTCSTRRHLVYLSDNYHKRRVPTQLVVPQDEVLKSLCNIRWKRVSRVLSLGPFQMIIVILVSKLTGKSGVRRYFS